MIQILQIIGSLEQGGAENFLMNLYKNIDRTEVKFDFAIYDHPTENSFYNEVLEMGAKVFFLPSKSQNFISNIQAIRKIVLENNYQYVWRHTDSCFGGVDLLAAKWGGATKLILHSHNSNNKGLEHILHWICKPIVNKHVTHRFSCGALAGKWMFGKREYKVIHNGVDVERFRTDETTRELYRNRYGLKGKYVIGHIARFCDVKNHTFLINVFSELVNRIPQAVLILIGGGPLEEQIRRQVKECNLVDKVLFLGVRTDVAELFQAMDVFMLPSLYEGLPVTLIEAQAAGLPCVVSSAVSKESDLFGEIDFLDLEVPLNVWVEVIEKKIGKRCVDAADKVREEGYDICTVAKEVKDLLEKM